jgi:AcrR family transcriptional regulator
MSLSVPSDSPASPEAPVPPRRKPGDPPRRFVAHNQHERIQAAAAKAIAARGFQATTVEDICTEAEITEKAFHEHFKDEQEAAMSALEAGVDQAMLDLRETFKAAPSWPEAIWDTFGAYLEWFAHEPAFARLAVVEIMAAGEPALELMQSLMDAFAMFLEPGYELAPEKLASRSLVDETVGNAVFGLLHEHILSDGPETVPMLLPEMVRAILTPFLGAEAARAFVAERSARE